MAGNFIGRFCDIVALFRWLFVREAQIHSDIPCKPAQAAFVRGRGLLLATWLLIPTAAFPFGDWTGHTHWDEVTLVPFVTGLLGPRDVLQNLLLGMPLGAVVGLRSSSVARALAKTMTLALMASLLGEWLQVWSHGRFPSATDVFCNVAGGLAAVVAIRRYRQRPQGERETADEGGSSSNRKQGSD